MANGIPVARSTCGNKRWLNKTGNQEDQEASGHRAVLSPPEGIPVAQTAHSPPPISSGDTPHSSPGVRLQCFPSGGPHLLDHQPRRKENGQSEAACVPGWPECCLCPVVLAHCCRAEVAGPSALFPECWSHPVLISVETGCYVSLMGRDLCFSLFIDKLLTVGPAAKVVLMGQQY